MRLTVSIRKNTSELQFAVDLEPFHLSSGLGDTVLSIRRKKTFHKIPSMVQT
jgi:hypothetical protein